MSELYNRLKKVERDKKAEPPAAVFEAAQPPEGEGFPIDGEILRQKEESRRRFKTGAIVGIVIFVIAMLGIGLIRGKKKPDRDLKPAKEPVVVDIPETPEPSKGEPKENPPSQEGKESQVAQAEKGTDIAISSGQVPVSPAKEEKLPEAVEAEPESSTPASNVGQPNPDGGKEVADLKTVAKPEAKPEVKSKPEPEVEPGIDENYFERAVTLYKENNMARSIEALKKGLRQNPQAAVGYNNLGVIYFQQGELNESLSQFNMALQLNPQYAEAHYNLALTLEQLGRNQTALYHYLKFIELAPPQLKQLQEYVKSHVDIY